MAGQRKAGGPSKLTQWQHRVRESQGLTIAEKCIAYTLSTYMNKDTLTAWPAFETLAAGAGCSRSTVKRAVRRLEAVGLLTRTPGQYTGTSSTYTGVLGEGVIDARGVGHSRTERGSLTTGEGVIDVKRGGHCDPLTCEDLTEHVRTTPVASRPSGADAPSGARSGFLPDFPAELSGRGWEHLPPHRVEARATSFEEFAANLNEHAVASDADGDSDTAASQRARAADFAAQAAAARAWLANAA